MESQFQKNILKSNYNIQKSILFYIFDFEINPVKCAIKNFDSNSVQKLNLYNSYYAIGAII